MTFFRLGRQRTGAHALCMQHSPNCCGALDFLSPEPCPQQPRVERIDYKIYGVIQQREYESWIKNTEEVKERLVEFWQCTDTAFEWKKPLSFSPVLTSSTEAQVIWGGIVKRPLIAYFIGNVSANKYQNAFTCVKVITNQRWDIFETQYIIVFFGTHPLLNSF